MKETLAVLETIRDYFAQISDFISQKDPSVVTRAEHALSKSSRAIAELREDVKVSKTEAAFRSIHLAESARKYLAVAFAAINRLEFSHYGSDLSKTRAAQLSSMWRGIAKMYADYLRRPVDIGVGIASVDPDTKPVDLSTFLHRYPRAYRLYAEAMTRYMDQPESDRTAAMLAVESDMSHALGERKWVSPYLAFGLTAGGERYPTIYAATGIKPEAESKGSADDLNAVAMALRALGVALVVIVREQPADGYTVLQNGLDPSRGLDTVTRSIFSAGAEEYHWEVKTWDAGERLVLVLESSGGVYRVMRPWPAPKVPPADADSKTDASAASGIPTIPRSRVSKIFDRAFGRPEAYYRLRDRLHRRFNARVQTIGRLQPSGPEFKFNHTLVVSAMEAAFDKTSGSLLERVLDNSVWKAFQEAIFEQSKSEQLSTLLYMVNTLDRMFRQDFERTVARVLFNGAAPPSDEKLWFRDTCAELFDQLMKRNDSIFGYLSLKSVMMTELRAHRGLKEN